MDLDASTIKALNTKTRQEIIKLLQKRPYTASELSKILNKHVTTISEHMETLEKSGLINRNEGRKWVYYNLTPKGSGIFSPGRAWTLVLSLSVVSFFIGALMLVPSGMQYSIEAMQTKTSGNEIGVATETVQPAMSTNAIIGAIFIAMAMIGLAYAAIKYIRVKAIRKHTLFYK